MEQLEWLAIALAVQHGAIDAERLCRQSKCTRTQASCAIHSLQKADILSENGAFLGECAPLSGGMTNHLIRFSLAGCPCLLRVPGEGTASLLNRRQECAVYKALSGRGISDEVLFFDPVGGYKITRFLGGVRNCDPNSEPNVAACMTILRQMHELGLTVPHEFDVYQKLADYAALCGGVSLPYPDWRETYHAVLSLRPLLDRFGRTKTLCHIDPVHDNFLFCKKDGLRLIDWEYAAMCDPDIDIAMFCLYAGYRQPQIDHVMDLYYCGVCPPAVRAKITCYVAICGLLWTYWCEYKKKNGVEYEAYARTQYDYARTFTPIALRRAAALGITLPEKKIHPANQPASRFLTCPL